ncbi:hypothetical protein [Thiocapsa imhoffii]|uniref:hypothetical protein n=1 Tax=Thiocapsa imhoffii TaxID=382777 RepID=UPI001905CF0E|nr:hypothetical protein [Thiocapsa imhoffii]
MTKKRLLILLLMVILLPGCSTSPQSAEPGTVSDHPVIYGQLGVSIDRVRVR